VGGSEAGAVADADLTGASAQRVQRGRELGGAGGDPGACAGGAVADAEGARRQPIAGSLYGDAEEPAGQQSHGDHFASGRCESSAWSKRAWIIGHDGKARRVGTSFRRLVDGFSAGM